MEITPHEEVRAGSLTDGASIRFLQEKMDFIYGELTGSQDGVSTGELAEKMGLSLIEVDKVLVWMEREKRVFRPQPDLWKVTT